MTLQEHQYLISDNFENLWIRHWGSESDTLSKEYQSSSDKFITFEYAGIFHYKILF